MLKAVRGCCARSGGFPPSWYPLTFELPSGMEEWKQHVHEHPEKRWIYKPNGGARGIGHILVTSVADVDSAEKPFRERCRPLRAEDLHASPLEERFFAPSGVIQEYVQDLQLLKGHKFAVRTYLLIARVSPLLVLLHGAAYAKVCGQAFDAARFTQADLLRHVTEQEFQKKGGEVHEDWKVWPVMLLDDLAAELCQDPGLAARWTSSFWQQVRGICSQVVESFREALREKSQLGMFEILGLDFVCKADGSVTFLEANRDPSWVIDGGAKAAIIPNMVSDMLGHVLRAHCDPSQAGTCLFTTPAARDHAFKFEVLIDDAHGAQGGYVLAEENAPIRMLAIRAHPWLCKPSMGCDGFCTSPVGTAIRNAAFYEGEEAGPISLAGRRMLPAQRLEIGDFLVVRLAEGELGASSEAKSVLRGDDLSGLLRASCGSDSAQVTEEAAAALQGPLVAPMPGAWLCATRKYVLVTAFDAGMDTSFALKVCIGVVEHLLSEGH
ncbi:unnamed protein product [Effrenium voratum]|nr:unnamed protein product [Effrenium voratum]